MKKLSMFLILCLILVSCTAPGSSEDTTPSQIEKPEFTKESMPKIDGSTATIPLSEALAADLLGLTSEKAAEYINHHKTHSAYVNLIDGSCDIIFVTPPSENELSLARDAGVELEVTPCVGDAFVFLINEENPVKDISLEDIRKIYRGEITNWSELGGEDLAIIPYQRPDNSGSQTLFYDLILPSGEAMSPPSELKIASMEGLVDHVSSYDGAQGAIGYSVYYFAKAMYENDNSALLAVDRVPPTDDTIAAGDYPLCSPYYAVTLKGLSEDAPAKKLLSYLLSDEGQEIAKAAGYVTIRPLS